MIVDSGCGGSTLVMDSFANTYRQYLQEELDSELVKRVGSFQPFRIDFSEPRSYKINCTKVLRVDAAKSLSVYRGVEVNTNELFEIYEWKIALDAYENKKWDLCVAKVIREKKKSIDLKAFWVFNIYLEILKGRQNC
jgi:hypothetical protein